VFSPVLQIYSWGLRDEWKRTHQDNPRRRSVESWGEVRGGYPLRLPREGDFRKEGDWDILIITERT